MKLRVPFSQVHLHHTGDDLKYGNYFCNIQFTKSLGDWGSIPGRVTPKTQKMVLDAALLNTQHYKVWIKGKVEQSRERSSALPST